MLTLESWIAIGALLLGVMFVLLMASFYNFLIGPEGQGPNIYVEIDGVIIQVISISGIPSLILSVIIIGIRREGTRLAGTLVLVNGITILSGMIIVEQIIPRIPDFQTISLASITPLVFIVVGIAIIGVGIILLKSKRRISKVDDLI